ncbi:unnamed protein product [Larinioides sclopetarius]|uniref:BTB domain-containing protein n=1 Tax=Larinioides sclopetarius TaxID=280406 RepID=A0AAV1YW04_9ARAC
MANDDSITFVQKDLPGNSFPIFEEVKRVGKLCDVTLKVEDRCFYAHRIILAGTIPYFHAMFMHDMVESTQEEITIKEIDPDALELLINFAYSGKVVISTLNVQSLLVGASFLQLIRVRDACCDFLKKRLHPNNVLGVQSFADALGCTTLVEATNRYIQMYFTEVARSEEFLNLKFEEIKDIVSRDELHITSEEQVFEAVLTWVKFDLNRTTHLPELLTQVRMPLLTPQYLTDHVATEELIRTSHQCRDLLDEAKDYHLMPERRPLLQSFRTRPRCCPDIIGCIYAVGGLTKSALNTVECYDPEKNQWTMVTSMSKHRSAAGVVAFEDHIYALGGHDGLSIFDSVERYNPLTGQWVAMPPMQTRRCRLGVATLNGQIYICGGYDGSTFLLTAEVYNPVTKQWSYIAPMNVMRSRVALVANCGKLYAIGGYDGTTNLSSVEVYNPEINRWDFVASMCAHEGGVGVGVIPSL